MISFAKVGLFSAQLRGHQRRVTCTVAAILSWGEKKGQVKCHTPVGLNLYIASVDHSEKGRRIAVASRD